MQVGYLTLLVHRDTIIDMKGENDMYIPETIRSYIGKDYSLNTIGCSGAQVLIFDEYVLKIEKDCNMSANERRMMQWLNGKLPVPNIIAAEHHGDTRYLLMSKIPGCYLCAADILDDQIKLADLVAEGLQRMWRIDVNECPTKRTLDDKFIEIEAGLRGGWITMDQASQDSTYGPQGFDSPSALFDWLVKNRPVEELVFSHGDYCLPNLFTENGNKISGYIDLGLSGVADKWVDIEKGLWSMWANSTGRFGGKIRSFDRKSLFDALEIVPDEDKLRYYSLLSELC